MSITYKPEIDGLRAIAVLAVVAYHAGWTVRAGFVGVDVFFVISGYLITKLLHDELRATGRIDFANFYARRARRILPALFVVVAATLASAVAWMPPAELADTAKAAAAAFVFSANVFFSASTDGYFDPDPQQNPLLHLWSLGVEEQFYIVWPVVLILARKRPVVALSILAALSFLLAEFLLWQGNQQVAFYQMPTRAWELALGGLVAMRPVTFPRWATWAGAVLVVASCFPTLAHFPGIGAMPAVLASAMLLAGIQQGHKIAPLAWKPMVWIGLISYSLYLWHWPLLVLGKGLPPMLAVCLSIAAAAFTYRYIETPFRHGLKLPPAKTVAVAAGVLGLSTAIAWALAPVIHVDRNTAPSIYAAGCDSFLANDDLNPCEFGDRQSRQVVVIVGDSVAMQWFPAIYPPLKNRRLIVLTKSSCPMIDVTVYNARINRDYVVCDTWREKALQFIEATKPESVIVGSSNDYPLTESEWIGGTSRVMDRIAKSTDHVHLMRSTPYIEIDGAHPFNDVARWQSTAVAGMRNVSQVDMNDVVCPQGICPANAGGVPVFKDGRHLSESYVASISLDLAARLQLTPEE